MPPSVGHSVQWWMGTGHRIWHFQYLERGSEPFLGGGSKLLLGDPHWVSGLHCPTGTSPPASLWGSEEVVPLQKAVCRHTVPGQDAHHEVQKLELQTWGLRHEAAKDPQLHVASVLLACLKPVAPPDTRDSPQCWGHCARGCISPEHKNLGPVDKQPQPSLRPKKEGQGEVVKWAPEEGSQPQTDPQTAENLAWGFEAFPQPSPISLQTLNMK